MKINIQKLLRVFAPFIACLNLILYMVVPASAAVIDPYDLAGHIIADGANDLLTISFPTDNFYWRALHDGSLSHTGYGQTFSYQTQMRYVDNDTVYFHPFGKDTFFPAKGVADDGAFDINISLPLVVRDATQTYGVTGKLYAWLRNSDGTSNAVVLSTVDISSIQTNVSVVPRFALQDLTLNLVGVDYFNFYVVLDFYGVASESDTAAVEVSCNSSIDLKMRISSFYRQNANNEEMKGIMNEINTQLDEQGQKLDQIMNGSQVDQDAANDFENNSSNQSDKIDDANDVLGNVTKPDIDDVPMDVGGYVPQDGNTTWRSLLAPLYESSVIMTPLMISLVFLVVRFVLYGKAR